MNEAIQTLRLIVVNIIMEKIIDYGLKHDPEFKTMCMMANVLELKLTFILEEKK